LREILSLLQKDVQDQVKDADLLREELALIDQDVPTDIKASIEPVSKLDDHFVVVKRALKNYPLNQLLNKSKLQISNL
jgi:hypothetical protein